MRNTLHPALRFLAATVAFAPLTVLAVQDCDLDGQSVNPANGNTTAGKTGLMRCKDRDSGELQREQELKNGVFMGLVRFYDKGKLVKEHSVNEKGNMDGRAREFAPSGQVIREASYRNGSVVGLVRSFYPSGPLRRASFHEEPGGERASVEYTEAGKLSSLRCGDKPLLAPAADDARLCGFTGGTSAVELFDAKGGLRVRMAYAGGKRVRGESLYDNGQPSVTEEVAGTQRTERRFSPEGVKRREIVSLLVERGAMRQRELEYSERGALVREQRWNAAGETIGDDAYYLNGQPRSKTAYSGEGTARIAETVEFHDNGQRAAQGRYSAANPRARLTPIGTHQRFNARGTLVSESIYDDKGHTTRERTWDDNGQPQRDDEVFEDGSRKAFTKK